MHELFTQVLSKKDLSKVCVSPLSIFHESVHDNDCYSHTHLLAKNISFKIQYNEFDQ